MPTPARHDTPTRIYVDNLTFDAYLQELRETHPDLYALLDPQRIAADAIGSYLETMDRMSWEFEANAAGGRGAAYNRTNLAQENLDNRRVGMVNLIKCFSPCYDAFPSPGFRILDVLGGGGTVARFLATLRTPMPTLITADLSNLMISACRPHRLPYIRQAASRSLLRDNVLDGVLIAYGSQLLDGEARQLAVSEAHRTLKPGHRLVLHAFEIGSGVGRFFDEVVHPYSRTGHAHQHFTRHEVLDLFMQAGFRDLRMFEMSDPFTLHGDTPEQARHHALMHVHRMYDLVKVSASEQEIDAALEPLVAATLGPIRVSPEQGRYIAEIPRTTLIAVGVKSD